MRGESKVVIEEIRMVRITKENVGLTTNITKKKRKSNGRLDETSYHGHGKKETGK